MPTFSITHLTDYRYQRIVAFGEHRMMLRPRDDEDQKAIQADLTISPKKLLGTVTSSTITLQSPDFLNNQTNCVSSATFILITLRDGLQWAT
jgi:hypothetical protein